MQPKTFSFLAVSLGFLLTSQTNTCFGHVSPDSTVSMTCEKGSEWSSFINIFVASKSAWPNPTVRF